MPNTSKTFILSSKCSGGWKLVLSEGRRQFRYWSSDWGYRSAASLSPSCSFCSRTTSPTLKERHGRGWSSSRLHLHRVLRQRLRRQQRDGPRRAVGPLGGLWQVFLSIYLWLDVCPVFASLPLIRANWSCLQRDSVSTHRRRHRISDLRVHPTSLRHRDNESNKFETLRRCIQPAWDLVRLSD